MSARVEELAALASVMGHPVRVRFLAMLAEPAGFSALSPAGYQLTRAEQRGVTIRRGLRGGLLFEREHPIGVVSYHVRTMAQEGLLAPAGQRRVRGAIEHFYRLTDEGRLVAEQLGLAD